MLKSYVMAAVYTKFRKGSSWTCAELWYYKEEKIKEFFELS